MCLRKAGLSEFPIQKVLPARVYTVSIPVSLDFVGRESLEASCLARH